jgi:hypothetical protein
MFSTRLYYCSANGRTFEADCQTPQAAAKMTALLLRVKPEQVAVSTRRPQPTTGERTMSSKTKKTAVKKDSPTIFGHSPTSVMRALGKAGITNAKAVVAVFKSGYKVKTTDASVRTFLYAGKKGQRGPGAELTESQLKQLTNAIDAEVESQNPATELKKAA